MTTTTSAVLGDHQSDLKNSSTTQADAPHRLVDTTTSARAAEPPQRSGPGANSEFDSSRDYFPVARLATATRPPADAPTMVEAVVLICGAQAHECICGLPVDHVGAHECQRDGGQWIGTIGDADFAAIRFPDPLWAGAE